MPHSFGNIFSMFHLTLKSSRLSIAGLLRCQVTQLRGYSKKKRQVIRSSHGKTLDAQPTEKKSKLFAFGNFASLLKPRREELEKSESTIEKIASFDSLRIFPTVRAAMIKEIKQGYNLKSTYVKDKDDLSIKPSPVQIAAIKKINQMRKPRKSQAHETNNSILQELIDENEKKKLKVFTIAAETGSGKTWAYLASVFSKLKEDDAHLFSRSKKLYEDSKQYETIRSIILLPTHELVEQVYKTAHDAATMPLDIETDVDAKSLAAPGFREFLKLPENQNSLNLNVVKWGSGDSHEKLFNACKRGRVDMLVTTPSKIQGLAKLTNIPRQFRFFNFVDYCVVDEADTLLDGSWFKDTATVLLRLTKLKDLIMCSATIPKDFNKSLKTMFKDESSVIKIVTPLIHKIPKQIVLKVIDAEQSPYHGSKTRCLAQALYAIHNDGTEAGFVKRILVFVNEKKDVEPLVDTLLTKYGHKRTDIIGVTGGDSATDRSEKIEPFIHSATPLEEDPDGSKIKVLVTTDLLARGLNFLGIKNVILMDVPRNSVDLIHRVGRTGRMRQSGRVFVIINKKSKKSWIKGLPRAIKHGATLG